MSKDEGTSKDRKEPSAPVPSLRPCRAGSARALIRQAGVLMAVPFPVAKTGYKDPSASKSGFDGTTTNEAFVKTVRAAADSTCDHKVLVPYRPNAPRNMARSLVTNNVGSQRPRGSRHADSVDLTEACAEAHMPWRTTNQVFNECAQVRNTVGIDNPGIAADVARRMHHEQGIYE